MANGELGHLHAGDLPDDGDLRQRAGGLVAVERERQGAAHPPIVERLLLVVDGDDQPAVPRALLHGDLVAERPDDVVALRRGESAELDVGAPGADGGRLSGVVADEERAVAVEIGLAAVPVAPGSAGRPSASP